MGPFVAFLMVFGGLAMGAFAIWNDYQLKQKRLDIERVRASDASGIPADSEEIRGILKEMLKHQARLTERVQNLEAIVTSALWDQKSAAQVSVSAPVAEQSDEEQAAAIARQIQAQERA